MGSYVKIFDELTRTKDITYTFTGRDRTFLIYAFCKGDVNFLTILDEINILALKYGLNEFCRKRSCHSKDADQYKAVFVFRVIDIENEMSNSAEFQLCYDFWFEFDFLGSMTWDIRNGQITITFYYNNENVDVEIMP